MAKVLHSVCEPFSCQSCHLTVEAVLAEVDAVRRAWPEPQRRVAVPGLLDPLLDVLPLDVPRLQDTIININ